VGIEKEKEERERDLLLKDLGVNEGCYINN
jgi:hypothetical protein